MAKKKNNKNNKNNKNDKKDSNDLSFKNNPFTAVKGFSASEPAKAAKPEKKVEKKEPVVVSPEDSEADFNRAMAQLGVETLGEDDTCLPREAAFDDDDDDPDDSPAEQEVTDDESLFLASLGQLDSVFNDNYSDDEDEGAEQAEPRRMKQLRQGKLRPQQTLDLHGCYRDEARKKVRHFLQNRCAEGLHTVLIVTGRGNRSPGGESVLRTDIERYLTTHAGAWVAEWGRAPRQYGGDGALVVFLRRGK
ncbi:MAG: Smr/MutS family protein [Desulfuromonas sp.]|nr:Smr/MutS family protein [Desulfuromonas sp.]